MFVEYVDRNVDLIESSDYFYLPISLLAMSQTLLKTRWSLRSILLLLHQMFLLLTAQKNVILQAI